MPHKTPRAPAGSRQKAAQVSRLVADLGKDAAAKELQVSPGYAARLASAYDKGRPLGKIIGSTKGLAKWSERIAAVEKNAPAAIRKVVKGEAAPEHHRRATRPEGRARQRQAADLRARYSDSQLAKAGGVSRQKATSIRLQLADGKELKPADANLLKKIDEELNKRDVGFKDGVLVLTPEQGRAMLANMSTKEQAQHHIVKPGMDWNGVKEWIKNINGMPHENVLVWNSGTASAPVWHFVMTYEKPPEFLPDDWEAGEEGSDSDYEDEE